MSFGLREDVPSILLKLEPTMARPLLEAITWREKSGTGVSKLKVSSYHLSTFSKSRFGSTLSSFSLTHARHKVHVINLMNLS